MSAKAQSHLSPEQYLERERSAEFRHEYYNGRMFAMSGGTYSHAQITLNFAAELHNALKKEPCRVLVNDLRIRIAPDGLYTYPDIVVACGELEFGDDKKDTLLNPVLIIEVLSPSTEAYDRGFKSAQYRKLTSLQEYAVVSQGEPRVEIFRRQQTGDWLLSEWSGMEATCRFASIHCSIALADIYANIVFSGSGATTSHPSPSE